MPPKIAESPLFSNKPSPSPLLTLTPTENCVFQSSSLVFYLVAPLKLLHPSRSIYHLAFPGEKGMTLTAYLHLHCLLGGASSEAITTSTNYRGISIILGMNLILHTT